MTATEHPAPAPWPPLTAEQRIHALDIATAYYRLPGQREHAIRLAFQKPSPTQFWQTINRWLDDETVLHELLAARPRAVKQLAAVRARRRAPGTLVLLGGGMGR